MRRYFFLLIAAGAIFSIARAYQVPRVTPKPLKETQDPAQVRAHEERVQREIKPNSPPVVEPDWIKQIQELATKNSHRESMPVESCKFIFRKDGSLAHLEIVIPTSASRTPNQAGQSHNICSASFDAKDGKLKLSDKTKVDGPDLRELFGVDQLPIICQELVGLRRFQQAFSANGLRYTLEADVIPAPDEKSWAWEVAPSEEQMPNVIYAMYYYPISGELRSAAIENSKVAKKVEATAKAASFHLTWVKSMDDR